MIDNSLEWDELVRRMTMRLSALRLERQPFEKMWRKVDNYVSSEAYGIPFRTGTVNQNIDTEQPNKVTDFVANRAVRTLMSGLMSGSTPPTKPWLMLTPKMVDPEFEQEVSHELATKVAERQRTVMEVYSKSNLYYMYNLAYEDLARYGTHVHILRRDPDTGIRLEHVPVYEAFLTKDHRFIVDGLYRVYLKSVSHLVEEFGEDKVGTEVMDHYKKGNMDLMYSVVNVIAERRYSNPESEFAKDFRFGSWHYLEGKRILLREGGYRQFPVVAPRWSVNSGQTYGYSPVMECLNDIIDLQEYREIERRSARESGYPQMLVDSKLRDKTFRFMPGAIHFVSDIRDQPIRPLFERPATIINEVKALIQDKQTSINNTLFVNIFMMINNMDERSMTATEVAARKEEQMLLMGHVVTRLQNEMLMPDAILTYNNLSEEGMFHDDGSDFEENLNIEVSFSSIIAQAQKSIGVTTIDRGLAFTQGLASINPEVTDLVDFDSTLRHYLDLLGLSSELTRDKSAVQELRESRAQAQEQEREMIYAEREAKMRKDIAGAQTTMTNSQLPGMM